MTGSRRYDRPWQIARPGSSREMQGSGRRVTGLGCPMVSIFLQSFRCVSVCFHVFYAFHLGFPLPQFSLCAGFAWAVFSSHRDRDEALHKMLALEKDGRGSKWLESLTKTFQNMVEHCIIHHHTISLLYHTASTYL